MPELFPRIVKKSQQGAGTAVKIGESAKIFGRHFDEKDVVLSRIMRESIDVLKVCPFQSMSIRIPLQIPFQTTFRDQVSKDDWDLLRALKVVSSRLLEAILMQY